MPNVRGSSSNKSTPASSSKKSSSSNKTSTSNQTASGRQGLSGLPGSSKTQGSANQTASGRQGLSSGLASNKGSSTSQGSALASRPSTPNPTFKGGFGNWNSASAAGLGTQGSGVTPQQVKTMTINPMMAAMAGPGAGLSSPPVNTNPIANAFAAKGFSVFGGKGTPAQNPAASLGNSAFGMGSAGFPAAGGSFSNPFQSPMAKVQGPPPAGPWTGAQLGSQWAPPPGSGQYRTPVSLTANDLTDEVLKTIAGEAYLNDPNSVDAVINTMLNRLQSGKYGPNLNHIALAGRGTSNPQFEGSRATTPEEATYIKERLTQLASGAIADNTKGALEFRANSPAGRNTQWYGANSGSVINVGGNLFQPGQITHTGKGPVTTSGPVPGAGWSAMAGRIGKAAAPKGSGLSPVQAAAMSSRPGALTPAEKAALAAFDARQLGQVAPATSTTTNFGPALAKFGKLTDGQQIQMVQQGTANLSPTDRLEFNTMLKEMPEEVRKVKGGPTYNPEIVGQWISTQSPKRQEIAARVFGVRMDESNGSTATPGAQPSTGRPAGTTTAQAPTARSAPTQGLPNRAEPSERHPWNPLQPQPTPKHEESNVALFLKTGDHKYLKGLSQLARANALAQYFKQNA